MVCDVDGGCGTGRDCVLEFLLEQHWEYSVCVRSLMNTS